MEHSGNVHYRHPTTSPMWCGNTMPVSNAINSYDGDYWYYWNPIYNYVLWYDHPFEEIMLNGNVCYRLQGNIWICPIETEQANAEPIPMPVPVTSGNIKPMISVTSVKMENHPEHISVMFGQVLNNLK